MADHVDAPVAVVRLAVLFLTLAGFGLPGVLAYIAAGWLLAER